MGTYNVGGYDGGSLEFYYIFEYIRVFKKIKKPYEDTTDILLVCLFKDPIIRIWLKAVADIYNVSLIFLFFQLR